MKKIIAILLFVLSIQIGAQTKPKLFSYGINSDYWKIDDYTQNYLSPVNCVELKNIKDEAILIYGHWEGKNRFLLYSFGINSAGKGNILKDKGVFHALTCDYKTTGVVEIFFKTQPSHIFYLDILKVPKETAKKYTSSFENPNPVKTINWADFVDVKETLKLVEGTPVLTSKSKAVPSTTTTPREREKSDSIATAIEKELNEQLNPGSTKVKKQEVGSTVTVLDKRTGKNSKGGVVFELYVDDTKKKTWCEVDGDTWENTSVNDKVENFKPKK